MCGNSWCDLYPGWLLPMLAHPLLTWGALGVMDLAAILLTYASLTRPMPRWCGALAWLALPAAIGMTTLFLVILASRLFQRVY